MAVSWEMDFGKQIDEHKTPKNAEANQQAEIQEITNTNDETTTSQTPRNQIGDTNDVAPSPPDFSNLTTNVGDNPDIRRPPPIESLPTPPPKKNHRLQLLDILRGKRQNKTCDLILNLTQILTSDD